MTRSPEAILLNRELAMAQFDFYHEPTASGREAIAQRTLTSRNAEAILRGASMMIETARCSGLSVAERKELVGRGHQALADLQQQQTQSRAITPFGARAALMAATSVSTERLYAKGRLPSPEVAATEYARLIDTASSIMTNFPKAASEDMRGELAGLFSELTVLALPMRFSIRNQLTGEYWPYWALATEDHGDSRAETDRQRWDVSIYTRFSGEPPELTYPIQVKTKASPSELRAIDKAKETGARHDTGYDDFISVVHVSQDLDFSRMSVRPASIVRDLVTEYKQPGDDKGLSWRLDRRADKLFNKLDQ